MVTQDQREIIAFLSRPTTHGPECVRVDTIETHSAIVFLAGARALKLKRAVRYNYLDFSTVERRRECCAAEVAVNHRTAPGLYRGVAVVTRDPLGGLTLDGVSTTVTKTSDSNGLVTALVNSGTIPTPVRIRATLVTSAVTTSSSNLSVAVGLPE